MPQGKGKRRGKRRDKRRPGSSTSGATRGTDAASDVYDAEVEAVPDSLMEPSGLPDNFVDEEISEDHALEPQDEEEFGAMLQPRRRKSRKDSDDLLTDSASDAGDEYYNLDDAWDADSSESPAGEHRDAQDDSADDPSQDSSLEELSLSEDDIHSSKEEGASSRHERLVAAMRELGDSGRRDNADSDDGAHRARVTEQGTESAYNLDPATAAGGLTLGDLVSAAGDRGSLDGLTAKANRLRKAKGAIVPMQEVHAERVRRKMAYSETSKEVTAYEPAIKRNREARTLKLAHEARTVVTTSSLAATMRPSNTMEDEIADILRSSGVTSESQIQAFEESQLTSLTAEEKEARTRELAKLRSLMFYQELKAKRRKKIKSRRYRALRRRDKEKSKLSLAELQVVDPEMAAREARKMEEARIKERMTLRHKNTSKWAKGVLRSGVIRDKDARAAVDRQLHIGRELRRKIQSMHSGGDSSSSNSSEDDDDDSDAVASASGAPLVGQDGEDVGTGLTSMLFMQRALRKQKAEAEDLRRELDDLDAVDAEEARAAEHPVEVYRRKLRKQAEGDDGDAGVEAGEVQRVHVDKGVAAARSAAKSTPKASKASGSVAAVLTKGGAAKASDRGSTQQPRASPKPEVHTTLLTEMAQQRLAEHGNEEDPLLGDEFTLGSNVDLLGGDDERQRALIQSAFAGDDVEAQFKKEKRDAEGAEEDPDKDTAATLPGWGSWTGAGVSKVEAARARRLAQIRAKQEKAKRAAARKAQPKRADHNLVNVIINERKDRAVAKYEVPQLPHPYTSAEQYEAAMAAPLGREWNTLNSTHALTAPEVMLKAGRIVAPLKKPKRKKSGSSGADAEAKSGKRSKGKRGTKGNARAKKRNKKA